MNSQSARAGQRLEPGARPGPLAWIPLLAIVCSSCGGLGNDTLPGLERTPTWSVEIQPLLAQRCAICHTDPPLNSAPTGFRLDRYDRADAGNQVNGAFEKRDRILERAVVARTMPLGGPPLDTAERALLRSWIEAGAPKEPTPAATRGLTQPLEVRR